MGVHLIMSGRQYEAVPVKVGSKTVYTLSIVNSTGTVLPATGSAGGLLLKIVQGLSLAGILFIGSLTLYRKKKYSH